MNLLHIKHDIISSAPRNCAVFIQAGYTCLFIGPGVQNKRPLIDLQIFAPRQTRNEKGETMGYKRRGFFLRAGPWHTPYSVSA